MRPATELFRSVDASCVRWSSKSGDAHSVLRAIRRLRTHYPAVVIAIWVLLAAGGNLAIPQLERVIHEHSQSFLPSDAEANVAAVRMGQLFGDSTSNNLTYVVFESDHPLAETDRSYYRGMVSALRLDHAHVESMLDLWSSPLTAPISQSADGRAVYLLLRLSGQSGSAKADASVAAVRSTIAQRPPPQGLRLYVSGPGASLLDEFRTLDIELIKITVVTVALIALLLLLVYRSVVTAALPLITVCLSLAVARPVIAALGASGIIEVSIFSAALMAAMVLGAGTDYAIFLLGRYHERRRNGVLVAPALAGAYRKVTPVIIASATTVTAALFCLTLTKVGTLRSAGIPCGIGILLAMLASLTLMPALIAVAANFGRVEPRQSSVSRRWRRVGTAVSRWPGAILVTAAAALVVCTLPLLGMRAGYSELTAQPGSTESSRGYQAMDRHFPRNQLLPEIVLIESDHDLRSPAGLIAIDRVTRQILAIPGVRSVQSASRPAGAPLSEAALTHQAGIIGDQLDTRADSPILDSIKTVRSTLAGLAGAVDQLERGLTGGADGLREVGTGTDTMQSGMQQLRGDVDTVSGYLDPLRHFVDGIPDCPDNLVCAPIQRLVDPVDGVVRSTDALSNSASQLNDGSAEAAAALASASAAVTTIRASLAEVGQLVDSIDPQLQRVTYYLTELGTDFQGTGSGGFYLPRSALSDPRFRQVEQMLFSPDGHATRLLVYGDGDAWGSEGARRSAEIEQAVGEANKDGTLVKPVVHITGVGSATANLRTFVEHGDRLLALVALTLIFLITALMLRSAVAGVVVVTTVVLSYASALGASVLVWQGLLGRELHWAVPALAFIALVAVGSDYNLLLVMRLKEEAHAGLKTAVIRAFGGTGGVVTTAGIVFGITMFAMLSGNVLSIAQVGSTIGIGLLIDTLVVRAFVVPSIVVLLGRWFWWSPRVSAFAVGGSPAFTKLIGAGGFPRIYRRHSPQPDAGGTASTPRKRMYLVRWCGMAVDLRAAAKTCRRMMARAVNVMTPRAAFNGRAEPLPATRRVAGAHRASVSPSHRPPFLDGTRNSVSPTGDRVIEDRRLPLERSHPRCASRHTATARHERRLTASLTSRRRATR
ncbi:MAG: MMPL/RND family transporter [Mycobacteriaceae bacterium]